MEKLSLSGLNSPLGVQQKRLSDLVSQEGLSCAQGLSIRLGRAKLLDSKASLASRLRSTLRGQPLFLSSDLLFHIDL